MNIIRNRCAKGKFIETLSIPDKRMDLSVYYYTIIALAYANAN